MNVFRQSLLLFFLSTVVLVGAQTALTETDSAIIDVMLKQWAKPDFEDRKPDDAARLDQLTYQCRQRGWLKLEQSLCRELGMYYRETGQPDAAQRWFKRLFDMNCETGDSLGIALALTHLGNTFMGQGDHKSAIEYNHRALGIRLRHQEEEQPLRLANSFMFVGLSFMRMGNLEKADEFYRRSFEIRVQKADSAGLDLLLGNMGTLALFQKKYDLAQACFQKSIDFQPEGRPRAQALGAYFQNIGEHYAEFGNDSLALLNMTQALAIFDTLKWERRRQQALFEIGKLQIRNGKREAGEAALAEAATIAEHRGALKIARDAYEQLYQSACQTGRYETALAHFQRYELYKDSLATLENRRSLARLTFEQEMIQKDQAIGLLQQSAEAQKLRQRYLLFGLALALILLSVIYNLNRLRRKAWLDMRRQKQEAETLLAEKETLLTDLRATQQQLVQHEKMAALGQLTAGIAHELNNPLNFILGNAEALRLDQADLHELLLANGLDRGAFVELDQEMTQLIKDIEHGSVRMRNIVHELGAFSRTEPGLPEEVDFKKVVADSLHLLQQRGAAKWPVEQVWPPGLPLVKGYPDKLVQLLSNLLANAFYALESRWGNQVDKGKIRISVAVVGQNMVVSLYDNGPGIDEAAQKKVFDPFFTTKPVGKGTGLGLAIAFSIVKTFKGEISVNSQLGEGTEFIVRLPFAD